MKFRHLAINNVLGNRHQYSAFFFSSVFAVMIFFIYAAFILHPDVRGGKIIGGEAVAIGMIGCECIIVIFSFFFVLYSFSAFLKSRKKEFALFLLFGTTKGQLRRMVLYENMLICLLSLGVGIGFGMLFSKLFFMIISEIISLDNPLRFYFPKTAILITAGGYMALFLVITMLAIRKAIKQEIIELMQASRQPKLPPRFSIWLVLLSIICLGSGYVLAYTMTPGNMLFIMLPVIALVVIGTYGLFTQSSVALLKGLQSNKSIHYKRTNMIIISQMIFKMKDNARILFLVSVLCAVILTASGTLNVFMNGSKEQLIDHAPQTFGFVETGLHAHNVVDPEDVRRILKEDGLELDYELQLVGLTVQAELPAINRELTAMLVSESDYNIQAARVKKRDQVKVAPGQAWFVYPYREMKKELVSKGEQISMKMNGKPLQLQMLGQKSGAISKPYGASGYLFVLNDQDYKELSAILPDELKTVAYGFELKKWESALKTGQKIEQLVPAHYKNAFESRVDSYHMFMQIASLTFFIAIFISILFFMASGSLLYFKLFTELQEDRAQLHSLRRIGVTRQEINKIVTVQIAILFFIPCVVGGLHAAFAMKAFYNIFSTNVLVYAGVVLLVYLAMQTVYFLIARRSYLKKVLVE
ncbi:ABC transporter permease [Paenibacillus eucommiae]|uniref:ABC transport system permease protein n=1 Tax=Paenibacillus eucommiae TaxID=1355755 RepID=A0ABS4JC40_9BACL|nr:ABC transporter permease [Paenibacillus eucommiae]MBP1996656.1 putative ABC transport system permease protein [Paenibacillus eucommiae]